MNGEHRVGEVLAGRFRVERLLGRGGMGAVYAASHAGLGHQVAVKVLTAEAARNPDAAARFAQEARIAARLSSPHVVRVHDLGQAPEGQPFIVMELLSGRDLASVIKSPEPLAIERAVRLVLEAAAGTAVAHAAGLVHRDLKPANLFLARQPDQSEIVKVLDFGLSKVLGPVDTALTQSATAFGTPQYMSPEQVMSAKHVDARCDQHALAMILFELLTKRPAFEAPTAGALTVVIVTRPAPSVRAARPDVPRELDEVIRRAMAKKPGDRFPDLGAFARALAPFGGHGARAFADGIARTLDNAPRLADVEVDASNQLVTVPEAPTMPGVTSGSARARTSALFWAASVVLVAAGVGASVAALAFRRFRDDAASATAAPSSISPAAPAPSASSAPIVDTPSVASAPEPPVSAASGAPEVTPGGAPASAASSAKAAPPRNVRRPRPPARDRAATPRDPSDPTEVFGRGP